MPTTKINYFIHNYIGSHMNLVSPHENLTFFVYLKLLLITENKIVINMIR